MMGKKHNLKLPSERQQQDYTRRARLQYDPATVNESVRRWEGYSKAEKEAILKEGQGVYADLVKAMRAGETPDSARVDAILARWHEHIRYFYEPTLDILRGLGNLYNTDPEFMAFFHRFDRDLPAYLQAAIGRYVETREDAELERMLANSEASPQANESLA